MRPPIDGGAIWPQTVQALKLLDDFLAARERRLTTFLYGRKLRSSPLREAIIRAAVIGHAEGNPLTIAHLQERLARLASPSSVRSEVVLLCSLGILEYEPGSAQRHRARPLAPTRRTISFYNQSMRSLIEAIHLASISLTGRSPNETGPSRQG